MTRKDYQLIAEAIKVQGDYLRDCMANGMNDHLAELNADRIRQGEFIALNLAKAFENENPRFDREKFLTACGVN